MTPTSIAQKLHEEPDFINSRRFKNSMAVLEIRYPEEAPDHVAAAVMNMTVEEFEAEYSRIVGKLRDSMKVEVGPPELRPSTIKVWWP